MPKAQGGGFPDGDGFPDMLVVDHDAKFTSEVFRAFVKRMGSTLIVD